MSAHHQSAVGRLHRRSLRKREQGRAKLRLELLEDRRMLASCDIESGANDTLGGAPTLPLSEQISGSGLLFACGSGVVTPSTDVDYWGFEALAGDNITVHARSLSAVNTSLELRNAADGFLASDTSGGPSNDALISSFVVQSSGTYFARVNSSSSTMGEYQVEIDVARTVAFESDRFSLNDVVSRANPI